MMTPIRWGLNFLVWLCWWIAGMVIFFNKKNNCGTIPATHGLHNLVLVVLIIDCVTVGLMACLLPIICCFCAQMVRALLPYLG
jgi:hypothetical protein